MALEEYQRKRDFRQTPEPSGAARRRGKQAAALSFVVQKHRATRLHYDFRLELDGVLLSWAVPKGPSLDPQEKRLAVHVEDHPIEYGGFEGVIPKGQYGGGTVLLWDRGTWTPLEPDPAAAYRKGALKFRLDGAKLHGNWALVRMGGKAAAKALGEKHENWLLIKERDEEAAPGSDAALVDDSPLSVATGRSMEAIAADRDRVWESGKGEVAGDPSPARKPLAAARPRAARKRAMPEKLVPQLATLADAPPEGEEWLHEIKYDGYRLLARIARGTVRLTTRGGLDWTDKFAALAKALAALPVESALLDGEIVALAPDGTTNFGELQDAIARRDTGGLVFYAFDLLYQDGWDLTEALLEDRKAALAAIVTHHGEGLVRYSDHQMGRGPEFFRHVCGYKLEGIVAKRRDRPYRPGRGRDWLKVKCDNRDEFVVVGFTEPAGRRHGFGALLIGYYDKAGRLHYAGRVGTGFNDAQLSAMRQRLDAIERPERPVAPPQGVSTRGVHWTEPRLVAQVRYGGWTTDGVLRHPAFLGLRDDKSPEEVVYESRDGDPRPADSPLTPTLAPRAGRGRAVATPRQPAPLPARGEREGPGAKRREGEGPSEPAPRRDGSVDFAGVRLTNPGRVLYREEGITKLQLAQYYAAIEGWALPQLAHRPLSLVRCPEGYDKQCFYQKHLSSGVPDALGRVEIAEKEGAKPETYLVIENLAGLIGVVQMGVLEIHPWGSTVKKLETPDRITFDFDPDEGLPWEEVTAAAIEMREALSGIGLQSFAKTTGGKGLHVVVPVAPKLGWEAVKEFSKWVAERFAAAYPQRFTTNMAKRARTGRIFIDYLRNGRGATAIGAYSARARAGAPVATPLFWEEVEAGVKPAAFTVLSVPGRLAKLTSDPWAELPKLRQSLSARVRREVGI
ncbi:MAG TPA: DNA ligase D [Stellaceae bacterium]|nr:DNA ligase D [Stellaceae bacterium]